MAHLGVSHSATRSTAKMQSLPSVIFIVLLGRSAVGDVAPEKYKLEQVQVLFRHGDRTPTVSYEGDPYKEIYQSYGLGQLTKAGKQRMYKVGQLLRKRYDDFLGEYKHDDVYAYSTDFDRTKTSLQLVLAGLYPPTPASSWSDSVHWQPIPTHYETIDMGFLTATNFCPEYVKLYKQAAQSPELTDMFHEYRDLFQRVSNSTGYYTSILFVSMPIHANLRSILSLGLALPAWCSEQDFRELGKASAATFKAMTQTEKLRRMIAGPVVERFLKAFNAKESSKKIHLYATSEYNIASFIDAHNISGVPALHEYGTALILEKLRGLDDRIYIRMYLWTGVSEELIFLKITNCEKTCPMSDYERIVQPILPDRSSEICTSFSSLARRRMESVEKFGLNYQPIDVFAELTRRPLQL